MSTKSESELPEYSFVSEGETTIGIRYLDEEVLLDMFGEKSNPFLKFGKGPATILDLFVESETNVTIHTNLIDLQVERELLKPVSDLRLKYHWEINLSRIGGSTSGSYTAGRKYMGWSYGKVSSRLKTYVLPQTFQVERGNSRNGFLVYAGEFPYQEKATLYIPVFNERGDILREFILNYEF